MVAFVFQYLEGAIRSFASSILEDIGITFNTSKVRLEGGSGEKEIENVTFQYLEGAIRRRRC